MKFQNAKAKQSKKLKAPVVSLDLWTSLYQKALAFYAMSPWLQVSGDQIFSITHPLTKQVGYCTILGSQGDFFGLTVYRGREALELHLKISKQELKIGDPEIAEIYDALVVDFSPRVAAEEEEDEKVRLSLPDPLCRETPSVTFRSYLPGYHAWYLNEEEANFLLLALECAMQYVEKHSKTPGSLSAHLSFSEDRIRHILLEPLPIKELPAVPINAKKMKALKNLKLHRDAPWELSTAYTPGSIHDKERPYLARVYLIVHQESAMILQIKPIAIDECPRKALCDGLLATIELHKNIPGEILLNKIEYYEAAKPLAKALGIAISLVETLPATEPALEGLVQYMRKEGS